MFKTQFLTALVAAISAVVTSVNAHGYVQEVTIGNTTYSGYLPYSDPYRNPVPDRIIRKIPGNGPIEDVTSIDLQCNGFSADGQPGTAPAALFATVAAGSEVHLNWTDWPDSHAGPMITYMAKAPSDITQWNPGNAQVWFKVHEAGKTPSGQWAATDILGQNNWVYTFTIPASLQPGQYIVRHEIIALHGAWNYLGAQFYPSCIQFQVTGSGSKPPPSSLLVSFPGAYTADDPGVFFDMYSDPSVLYPIPGPPVWDGN